MVHKVMLDLETLGNVSNSVIVSIGVVKFNENELGEGFHCNVDIDSCLAYGLKVSGPTIRWWMDQSEEARAVFQQNGLPLPEALERFSYFFGDAKELWANGVSFDESILGNAYKACGMIPPWKFWGVMDYRTVKNMVPRSVFEACLRKPQVAHNALSDAEAQAQTLINLMKHIKVEEVSDSVKQSHVA